MRQLRRITATVPGAGGRGLPATGSARTDQPTRRPPRRPVRLQTWEQLTHPAPGDDDDPRRQALAATFHDHPLLQAARTDYRQLTEQAGLTVQTCQEPPGWRHQQQALAEGIIGAESHLTGDMGRHYPAMARVLLTNLPKVRYILTVALRPADATVFPQDR